MTITAIFSLVIPLIFSLLVIYLNNRHNRKSKELELTASLTKHLFERKTEVIEKGFVNANMTISVLSELLLVYEGFLTSIHAPDQVNIKMGYIKALNDKILINIESAFITDLYCDLNLDSMMRANQIGKELYTQQSELEMLSSKRDELFHIHQKSANIEDYNSFIKAYDEEMEKPKIIIPLLKELRKLCGEEKELLKNELKIQKRINLTYK